MACRTMFLKLEQKGLISLPARQRPSNNHGACRPVALLMAQPVVEPIESRLGILEPLCLAPAQSREELSQQRNWGRNLHLIRSATPMFAVHSFSKCALAQTQVFSVLLAFLSS